MFQKHAFFTVVKGMTTVKLPLGYEKYCFIKASNSILMMFGRIILFVFRLRAVKTYKDEHFYCIENKRNSKFDETERDFL